MFLVPDHAAVYSSLNNHLLRSMTIIDGHAASCRARFVFVAWLSRSASCDSTSTPAMPKRLAICS